MRNPALVVLFTLLVFKAQAVTLNEAVQSALQKNESVGQGREQVVQAEEQYNQAKSTVYPNLSLNANHMIQPKIDDPLAAQFSPERQTTVNLTLKQPLFRGFREFAAMRQRDDLLSAQKQDRFTQLIQLYQNVAASYLNVLALERDLKNLGEQRRLYAQRIQELQARTRRGESQPTDTLTAQSTAAALDAEAQLVQAQLKTSRENLAYLTALPVDVRLSEDEDSFEKGKMKSVSDYLARIEERPDIKRAKELMRASEEEVSIARGGHWPSLDFTGNYYLQRPDGYLKDSKWDALFAFSLPIFEGGLHQSQVREAVSKRGGSELELTRLRRQTVAEIKSLHESLRMRVDQLEALKKASDLAEKNYQLMQRDYRRGLAKNIDVQMAMTEYRVTKRTYDQARYQARLDHIRLETAAVFLPPALTKEM